MAALGPVADAALGTYELLENILLYLPLTDLLLAQRVNKDWRAVVDRSERILQALFFRTAHDALLSCSFDKQNMLNFTCTNPTPANSSSPKPTLNPLITGFLVAPTIWSERLLYDPMNPSGEWEEMLGDDDKFNDTVLHPDASWKRMFLTQPAICEISIGTQASSPDSPSELRSTY